MTGNLQTLTTIPINGDVEGVAIRNGNNVALACPCGYRLPLIWSGNTHKDPVTCPKCKMQFLGDEQSPQNPEHITGKKSSQTAPEDWHITIPVKLRTKLEYVAVRRGGGGGGNAAWMCICGYHLPLLWSKFLSEHSSQPFVRCIGCDSMYTGISRSGEGIEGIKQEK